LIGGLVEHLEHWRSRVVTFPHPAAGEFDSSRGYRIRRVPALPGGLVRVAEMNLAAIAEAGARRPDAILSAHIYGSPAAELARRLRGVPVVQYLHADEVTGRPRVARFAVRHADAVVVVSEHTAALAR